MAELIYLEHVKGAASNIEKHRLVDRRPPPALYELNFEHQGFELIDFNDRGNSIVSFIRKAKTGRMGGYAGVYP